MVRSSDVLSLLTSDPLQFWPLQSDLTKQERAVRLARLGIYIAAVYSFKTRDPQYVILAAGAAYSFVSMTQLKATVDLSSAGLAKTPNPVGNAPVGDVTGRDTVAYIGSHLSESTLIDRMQNPSEGYLDRAISPTPSPFDAPMIGGGEVDLGNNVNTRFDSRGDKGLANVASNKQLTVPPR